MKVPHQSTSLDIWRQKYQLKDKDGTPLEETMEDTFRRVAKALAAVEPRDQVFWEEQFFLAMRDLGCVPAGRILANAGAEEYKPATSTINCTVSRNIDDSIDGILKAVYEAGMTLKGGSGIGYCFTSLRPKGAYVSGAGAYTSGALSFMDIFDSMCFTIASAGGRRGAQMGTMHAFHPDIEDFITAKRQDGRLRQFNLSVLITDDFMEAVKSDGEWKLVHPVREGHPPCEEVVFYDWPFESDEFIYSPDGKVLCKVYKTIQARDLWDLIMRSTYDFAEPGFILIDQVNNNNNNWFCEDIVATNPCGEQPLPPYGSCLLGSINLAEFVENPFTDDAYFDLKRFTEAVKIFTRMLDNIVEINGLALPEQVHEIEYKRRHGMGFTGLGTVFNLLQIPYGSDKSMELTTEISMAMAITGVKTGIELAKVKGPAPIMEDDFLIDEKMLRKCPDLGLEFEPGDVVKGKELFSYSDYLHRLDEYEDILNQVREHGCRFTHHSSIAPTGTISLSIGNNVSNGIEPTFAHEYSRNVIQPGKNTKDQVVVKSYEALVLDALKEANPEVDFSDVVLESTDDIDVYDHLRIQAECQYFIDSSISKTINVPRDIPFQEFENVYMDGYERKLKGVTTFRFNPEAFSGVLVKKSDLENTYYTFVLDDGEEVTLRGDEQVEYEGETHVAANLFDAIKEGYYGKF